MNTAQIDPIKPDLKKFPNFSKAKAILCTLKEGMNFKNMDMFNTYYNTNYYNYEY